MFRTVSAYSPDRFRQTLRIMSAHIRHTRLLAHNPVRRIVRHRLCMTAHPFRQRVKPPARFLIQRIGRDGKPFFRNRHGIRHTHGRRQIPLFGFRSRLIIRLNPRVIRLLDFLAHRFGDLPEIRNTLNIKARLFRQSLAPARIQAVEVLTRRQRRDTRNPARRRGSRTTRTTRRNRNRTARRTAGAHIAVSGRNTAPVRARCPFRRHIIRNLRRFHIIRHRRRHSRARIHRQSSGRRNRTVIRINPHRLRRLSPIFSRYIRILTRQTIRHHTRIQKFRLILRRNTRNIRLFFHLTRQFLRVGRIAVGGAAEKLLRLLLLRTVHKLLQSQIQLIVMRRIKPRAALFHAAVQSRLHRRTQRLRLFRSQLARLPIALNIPLRIRQRIRLLFSRQPKRVSHRRISLRSDKLHRRMPQRRESLQSRPLLVPFPVCQPRTQILASSLARHIQRISRRVPCRTAQTALGRLLRRQCSKFRRSLSRRNRRLIRRRNTHFL